jgi:phospholipase C
MISPFARRGHVSHRVYDHTSILKMIEWRWGLAPLSVRDAAANNIALDLDFSDPNTDAPAFNVPAAPQGEPCQNSLPFGEETEWSGMRAKARRRGFAG